jgi:predicted RNA-binding Zn-ribbon protein involved in translation (DUF1610 family)
MSTTAAPLSLADLEAFDPRAPQGERERRFLCPLCGDGKPMDAPHRSLCANLQSGAWNCKRCGATGRLSDFWTERPPINRRARLHQSLHHAFEVAPAVSQPDASTESGEAAAWRRQLRGLCPLHDTTGSKYFDGRGIPCEIAHGAGARLGRDFYGRPAVVFPIRDRAGALVAASGRYIDGRDTPKTRIAGPKRDGVFLAPVQVQSTLPSGRRAFAPFDKDLPAIIVTEAPIDAMSIAAAGYAAIALCGTTGPSWLHLACGFRRVLLAFDADEAGDNAAAVWSGALASYGASCERLRPDGGKDWNEVLCSGGAAALSDWLAPRVLLDTMARAQVEAWQDETLFDE